MEDCIPYIEHNFRVKTGKGNRAVAGLSMGSMQASMLAMTHGDLFAWVGIFSGFVQSLPVISQDNTHLQALQDAAAFRSGYRLFFRAMGEQDPFMGAFLSDRELLARHGLSPEQWPAHVETLYPGSHDWNVWRRCIRDFLAGIFR